MTCGHTKLMPRQYVVRVRRRSWKFFLLLSCGHTVERSYVAKRTHCDKCHAEQKEPCSPRCHISCANRLRGTTCHSEATARRHKQLASLALLR